MYRYVLLYSITIILLQHLFYFPILLSDNLNCTWELIGPGDADMVTSLSISKNNEIFLGTDIGGLYHSTDDGNSWTPLNNGLKNYDIITSVLFSPDSDDTIFLGTRGGFYKSINRGLSWEAKWNGLPGPKTSEISAPIGFIAIHPLDPSRMFIGFGYRHDTTDAAFISLKSSWNGIIYESNDQGETWSEKFSFTPGTAFHRMAFSPNNAGVFIIASSTGLYKSINNGQSWEKIRSGDIRDVIVHPLIDGLILASAGANGTWISENMGSTWEKAISGLTIDLDSNYGMLCLSNDGRYAYLLNSTWASSGGVYQMNFDDRIWLNITDFENRNLIGEAWLPGSKRVNAFAINPNSSSYFTLGTSRYVYSSEDSGKNWNQLISNEVNESKWTHRGLNVFGGTRCIAVNPNNRKRLYVGTADHGLIVSDDEGISWYPSMEGLVYNSTIQDIIIDADEPNNVYVINLKGLDKYRVAHSENYGKTWNEIYTGLNENNPIYCISFGDKKGCLFVGGKKGVWKREATDNEWQKYGSGFSYTDEVRCLVRHPEFNRTFFAGTNRGIFVSQDNGESWNLIPDFPAEIYKIIIDQVSPYAVYACTRRNNKISGGFYKSPDMGKTWEKILDADWVSGAVHLPQTDIFYVTTTDHNYRDESCGQGVFTSFDGGKSWNKNNNGLATLRANAITSTNSTPYLIYIGSQGSGLYRQNPFSKPSSLRFLNHEIIERDK